MVDYTEIAEETKKKEIKCCNNLSTPPPYLKQKLLTFLFFMDLAIFFGNLDGSRSLRRFTYLSFVEWPQNSFEQDNGAQ